MPKTEHERPTGKQFSYIINGKKYTQSMLVLDQVQQVGELLEGSGLSGCDPTKIFNYLIRKDLLPAAAAILLLPENLSLKDKDIKALTETLKFELNLETAVKICTDFFSANAIGDVLDKLSTALDVLTEKMQRMAKKITTPSGRA